MSPPVHLVPEHAADDQLRTLLAPTAQILADGGVVAFPTETVYGLGASALDPAAVQRIFRAKGRPSDNPLIVHVTDLDDARRVTDHLTPLAERLARAFWPGPLTLVLQSGSDLPSVTTGGLGSVAVRAPDHPVARCLIALAGVPIAAPSANRSGRPSPTTAGHVVADFPNGVDAIVDAGPCRIGIESTVVDARGATPVILRHGSVTAERLQRVALDAAVHDADRTAGGGLTTVADRVDVQASPGTRHAHYQPTAEVVLAPAGQGPTAAARLSRGRVVGYLGLTPLADQQRVVSLGRPVDRAGLATQLYAALRRADDLDLDVVVIEEIPETGIGVAIMDRLRRAAG